MDNLTVGIPSMFETIWLISLIHHALLLARKNTTSAVSLSLKEGLLVIIFSSCMHGWMVGGRQKQLYQLELLFKFSSNKEQIIGMYKGTIKHAHSKCNSNSHANLEDVIYSTWGKEDKQKHCVIYYRLRPCKSETDSDKWDNSLTIVHNQTTLYLQVLKNTTKLTNEPVKARKKAE